MIYIDVERYERNLNRALDNPIPRGLRNTIEDEIEPLTMNRYMDHSDTMDAIAIAYQFILDYQREARGD